jgi:hypothetical protein
MSEIPAESSGDLPDLEAVAGSFFAQSEAKEADAGLGEGLADVSSLPDESPRPAPKTTGNKAQPLKGDFNPRELAAGIRTVLNKD